MVKSILFWISWLTIALTVFFPGVHIDEVRQTLAAIEVIEAAEKDLGLSDHLSQIFSVSCYLYSAQLSHILFFYQILILVWIVIVKLFLRM